MMDPDPSHDTAIAALSATLEPGASTDDRPITHTTPSTYLIAALEDAERLLKYAAETGLEVDDTTRRPILDARTAVTTGWNDAKAAALLAALTKLATQLKPVTAEGLHSFENRSPSWKY